MGDFTFHADVADKRDLEKIVKNFNTLDDRTEIRKVLKQAGTDVKDEGKKNLRTFKFKNSRLTVPKSITGFRYNSPGRKTGNLMRSMKSQIKKNRVGIKMYAGFVGTGGHHAHLIDRGTKERTANKPGTFMYIKKGVKHFVTTKKRGSVKAGAPNTGSNFWTKAVHKEGPAAQSKLNDAIITALTKITTR